MAFQPLSGISRQAGCSLALTSSGQTGRGQRPRSSECEALVHNEGSLDGEESMTDCSPLPSALQEGQLTRDEDEQMR